MKRLFYRSFSGKVCLSHSKWNCKYQYITKMTAAGAAVSE